MIDHRGMSGYETDDTWTAEQIAKDFAAEYRAAMSQLDVEVKPHGARPKPTRTRSGMLLLLFAALENSDVYPRMCSLPTITTDGSPRLPVQDRYPVEFDCGQFRVYIEYVTFHMATGERVLRWGGITAVHLDTGQRITVPDMDDADREDVTEQPLRWLSAYLPKPELDRFSPLVQLSLDQLADDRKEHRRDYPVVMREDSEGRRYRWANDELKLWYDARGRKMYEG